MMCESVTMLFSLSKTNDGSLDIILDVDRKKRGLTSFDRCTCTWFKTNSDLYTVGTW
jgi:hypothetical protein